MNPDSIAAVAPLSRPLRLVFVCAQNANRSQMAEAWANLLGGEQVEAFSAGSQPTAALHAPAIVSMAELGYDMEGQAPKPLAALPDIKFDAAISMGADHACAALRAVYREAWAIPDARHLPASQFRAVRNLIGWRVYDLLLDLGLTPLRSVLPFRKP